MDEYKALLKENKISEDEIAKILSSLEKCSKVGIAEKDMERIIKNIISDPKYREAFIKDLRSAVRKLGIDPQPSP